MNSFNTCPKQWQLHKTGAVRIPTDTDFRDLGTLTHEAIKEYFSMIGDHPSSDNIRSIFTAVFEQHFEQYRLTRLRLRADKLRDNFISFEISRLKTWKNYRPTLVEIKLEARGYVTIVDFYSQPNRTLIDWKTGNKQDLTDDDLRQSKVMEVVLKEKGYPVEKIFFVALYPNRSFEIPHIADGFIDHEREHMLHSIQLGQFSRLGIDRGLCSWCDVVLSCQLEECNLWTL